MQLSNTSRAADMLRASSMPNLAVHPTLATVERVPNLCALQCTAYAYPLSCESPFAALGCEEAVARVETQSRGVPHVHAVVWLPVRAAEPRDVACVLRTRCEVD